MNCTIRRLSFSIIIMLFSTSHNINAEIYRWKDSSGRTHYSDKTPPNQVKKSRNNILLGIIKKDNYCTSPSGSSVKSSNSFLSRDDSPSLYYKIRKKLEKNMRRLGTNVSSSKTTSNKLLSNNTVLNLPKNNLPVNNTALSNLPSINNINLENNTTPQITKNTNEQINYMPKVDLTKEPAKAIGFTDIRVINNDMVARQRTDNSGDFRIPCDFSHMSNDDPIVYPGVKGAAHHHTFFGNTGANYQSTTESLKSTGNSTCLGGIMNRSAYWVPSMIDTATNAPIKPKSALFYYKTGFSDAVEKLPDGLRMIAGNAKSTTEQPNITRYTCNADYATRQLHIPACTKGQTMEYMLIFPMCWDGKNLDSPDHKSHMSYSLPYLWPRPSSMPNQCPVSHPIRIPEITFNVTYDVTLDTCTKHWRLSSDNYATTDKAGYSLHGDWWNGWNPLFSNEFLNNCLKARKDCHAHLLGDNRQIH